MEIRVDNNYNAITEDVNVDSDWLAIMKINK